MMYCWAIELQLDWTKDVCSRNFPIPIFSMKFYRYLESAAVVPAVIELVS